MLSQVFPFHFQLNYPTKDNTTVSHYLYPFAFTKTLIDTQKKNAASCYLAFLLPKKRTDRWHILQSICCLQTICFMVIVCHLHYTRKDAHILSRLLILRACKRATVCVCTCVQNNHTLLSFGIV